MSYEIVKRITKKDNKIFITSACNNVHPRDYYTWEFAKSENDEEKRNLLLFHNIIGNSLQLDNCSSIKWKYALERFYDYCNDNKIDKSDIWDLYYSKGIESLKPYYEIFEKYLNEKDNNKYYITSNFGIIRKVTKKNFYYDSNLNNIDKYLFDFRTANLYLKKFGKDKVEYYDIKINLFDDKNKTKNENNEILDKENELEVSL